MPFIRQAKPPKEVFALATPQHMLTKLAWEIGKFEQALAAQGKEDGDFQSACYFAFNCAVTALHCADWAWSSAGEETRAQLAKDFRFEITANKRKNITSFCDAIGENNREFFACRLIANGSKHMFLHQKDHPIQAAIEYSARGENLEQPIYTVDFLIKDGEESSLAIHVFWRVFEFWRDLFERVGYIEPRFVEGGSPPR